MSDVEDPLPPFSPVARVAVTSVERLQAVLEAYHRPQWCGPVPGDDSVERRAAHGWTVKVDRTTGEIVSVGAAEQSSAEPESLREVRAPKCGKRGGSGNRLPTTYAEVIERLKDAGCTVDSRRSGHLRVILPNGDRRTLPKTASDWRSIRNTVSQFAADGIDLHRPTG